MAVAAWHHFRAEVPAAWEATRYTLSDRVGRVEFSSREGFQALVSWQKLRREPDLARMAEAFFLRQAAARSVVPPRPEETIRRDQAGAFAVAWCGSGHPLLAAAYRPATGMFMQWIFDHYDPERWRRGWRPLLLSCTANDGPVRAWRLFGLGVALPAEYTLEEVSVYPAQVAWRFESARRRTVTVRRWGLPGELLRGSNLADFYRRVVGSGGRQVRALEPVVRHGRQAVRAEYRQRGEYRMDKMAGRSWIGTGWAWLDEAEQRIYAIEQAGRGGPPALPVAQVFDGLPSAEGWT